MTPLVWVLGPNGSCSIAVRMVVKASRLVPDQHAGDLRPTSAIGSSVLWCCRMDAQDALGYNARRGGKDGRRVVGEDTRGLCAEGRVEWEGPLRTSRPGRSRQ